jgi:cysteine desulfurase/selenocysteine lyase
MMQQTFDYLDHSWNPFHDGRLFEYSTIPWDHVAALGVIAEDIFSRYPMEDISNEVFRLQDLFLDGLDQDFYRVQHFDEKHRSGIVSIVPKRGDAVKLAKILTQEKVIVTERGGYLRVAPHFYLDDEQIVEAAVVFNRVISQIQE